MANIILRPLNDDLLQEVIDICTDDLKVWLDEISYGDVGTEPNWIQNEVKRCHFQFEDNLITRPPLFLMKQYIMTSECLLCSLTADYEDQDQQWAEDLIDLRLRLTVYKACLYNNFDLTHMTRNGYERSEN